MLAFFKVFVWKEKEKENKRKSQAPKEAPLFVSPEERAVLGAFGRVARNPSFSSATKQTHRALSSPTFIWFAFIYPFPSNSFFPLENAQRYLHMSVDALLSLVLYFWLKSVLTTLKGGCVCLWHLSSEQIPPFSLETRHSLLQPVYFCTYFHLLECMHALIFHNWDCLDAC